MLELGAETQDRLATDENNSSTETVRTESLRTFARNHAFVLELVSVDFAWSAWPVKLRKEGGKLNIKKSLITIVSAIFITAVTHAQETSEDLTAERHQLAQQKAELDAREKALDRREKKLAEKEKATASSTLQSREKGKAKAKHQQTIAQSQEEQAKAARAEKKLHEPFFQRLDEAFLEQLGTPPTRHPIPTRRTRVAFHRHRSILHRSRRPIGRSMEHRSSGIRVSFILIH